MKEFWSNRIQNMVPYTPGEQPQGRTFIKLNTNENPYPPSPNALTAITQAANADLRLYPDPTCATLRAAIAQPLGLTPDWVFCGNGSDEILAFAFQSFFDPEHPVTFPDVTYSFYQVYANFFGISPHIVPVNADFSIPAATLHNCPGGVVLANPNAPTGQALAIDEMAAIVSANPHHVVLVDEAYVDFGGESATTLVEKYPNLLVVQTLSKSRSLAGLRVGWAVGNPNLMAALCCVRDSINSYTVDRIAAAGAIAALKDTAYFDKTRLAIIRTRTDTKNALTALGFTVIPSQANFLFVSHPTQSGEALYHGLREKGILVRRWNLPRIDQHLRITIGTDQEMTSLCQALAQLIR